MKENPFSSLQSQNPISQAQESAENVRRAVNQAQSHPREETIQNARNAIKKAENAIAQAEGRMNQEPIERAKESLEQDRADLEQVENQFK
ncbi:MULTISPECIES: hypothetical protein [Paenibacillus]|uniref:hypothetical protein n=1 Tax=Paenibacillus TaxID=44249 RepID=UPI002FE2D481